MVRPETYRKADMMSKKIHLNIGGMTCINCQNRIEKGLTSTDGVIRASVSYTKGTADIEYDEIRVSRDDIVKKIEALDYEVLSGNGSIFLRLSTAPCSYLFARDGNRFLCIFYMPETYSALFRHHHILSTFLNICSSKHDS